MLKIKASIPTVTKQLPKKDFAASPKENVRHQADKQHS